MDVKTVFDIVESGVKTEIIIGASWTYWKFVIQRASEPATNLDIDVKFVGKQDSKWIIEITATLENKSQARLEYKDLQITARYFLAGDKIEDGGPQIKYQLNAPRSIDERIGGKERFFVTPPYINPTQLFRHRYVTYISGDATFVWIQTKLSIHPKGGWQKVNAQRIFRASE